MYKLCLRNAAQIVQVATNNEKFKTGAAMSKVRCTRQKKHKLHVINHHIWLFDLFCS